ncbi:virulence associated protein E [Caudoviricetes sp.]|nr:virulence associated protein E [Caudoviricetes sp.]
MLDALEVIRQFTEKMNEAGIYIGDNTQIEPDNQIHEFYVLGHKNRRKKNGRYRLWIQGEIAVGFFWDWASGIQKTWFFGKSMRSLSKKERDAIQKEIEEKRQEAQRQKDEANQKARELAAEIWNNASPQESHPYLKDKQVTVKGVRVGEFPPVKASNALIIPLIDCNGSIHSLQAIYYENGTRKRHFLKDGVVKAKYFPIGDFDTSETIILTEGLSTGASIHMATGISVAVCFSVGQIANVAEVLKRRYPETRFVVACELDSETKKTAKVSEDAGMACVRNFGALLVTPPPDTQGTDFNDLHVSKGLKAVADVIFKTLEDRDKDDASLFFKGYDLEDTPIPLDMVNYKQSLTETDDKGKPLATLENFKEILNRTGIRLLYNNMIHSCDVIMPNEHKNLYELQRDSAKNTRNEEQLFSWLSRFRYPKGDRREQMLAIAFEREYHPVKEWILSEAWDYQDRFSDLLGTLEFARPEREEFYSTMLRRWMLSAIATLFHKSDQDEGLDVHSVLTLLGGQGKGKTRWIRKLVPARMGALIDSVIFDTRNKDDILKVIKHWIVELGELDATFNKSDVNALKGFLTARSDVIRPPYGRADRKFPRRTVFCASVNVENYLQDPTGNRRYLTLHLESLNSEHNINMQQLWSQIYYEYKQGNKWWFDTEEYGELNAINEKHTSVSPVYEMLDAGFNWTEGFRNNFLNTTMALRQCGMDNPRRADVNEAVKYFTEKGLEKTARKGIQGYLLPPSKKSESSSNIF